MLDHVSIRVANYSRSKAFYLAALAPLGYTLAIESSSGAGFRKGDIPAFWIKQGTPASAPGLAFAAPLEGCGGPLLHIAFAANSRRAVHAFYEAALRVGGRDNGPPFLRPIYHPNYYGAFVIDPDGYNVEAVCHQADEA